MMKAVSASKMLISIYQTNTHNTPEGTHLHTRHHENLKPKVFFLTIFHYTVELSHTQVNATTEDVLKICKKVGSIKHYMLVYNAQFSSSSDHI
jgi:hypothetical protein